MVLWLQKSESKPLRVYLLVAVALTLLALAHGGCKREQRSFQVSPPDAKPAGGIRLSELEPGKARAPAHDINGYEENAPALAEGKRLYSSYNCVGCHAHGGGGMGPALIDRKWIYGAAPEQIFATIAEGRPNGMPAWGDKLTRQQIWQLVAYVRSMSGLVRSDVATGRDDHMKTNPPENSIDQTPNQAPAVPKANESRQ